MWAFRSCSDCNVVYLDPHPSRTSIGKAYAVYYTHADEPSTQPAQGFWRIVNEAARKTVEARDFVYVKFVWTQGSIGARTLGPIFEKLAPRAIAAIAFKLRHLQPAKRKGASFLDIGSGDGAFLTTAENSAILLSLKA